MKKTMLSVVLSFFAVIVCAFAFGSEDISASAVNDFSVTVEQLAAPDHSLTLAGDYKVTIWFENSSSIISTGFGLFYDDENFTPVIDVLEGQAHYTLGAASTECMAVVEVASGEFGFAFMRYNPKVYNGAFVTVYLRPTGTNTDALPITALVVDQVVDGNKQEVDFTVSQYCEIIAPVQYVVGDANVSGGISIFDSTYIKRMIANANGTTITAANYQNYLLAHEVGDFVCSFDAIDVNGDGVLTEADALIIENTLAGQGTSGNIYDGCSVYYVISTTNPTAA